MGDSPADVQKQHLQPSQPAAQHRPLKLQQPAGQEGCGTGGCGGLSP